jgi:hypothetical protein
MIEFIKKYGVMIIIVLLVAAIFMVPSMMEQVRLTKFGEPLTLHELPPDTICLHRGVQYQDMSEEKIAVIMLRTPLTIEETKEFFSDILKTEAAEKYNLILNAEEVAETDLGVVKEQGYYDENMNYYFVYIYSTESAEK